MSILRRTAPYRSACRTVLVVMIAALFCSPTSVTAQANDDAAYCKAAVGYLYRSNGGHVYIGTAARGADALSGKVYYTVSNVDISRTYQIDGTFWVYAYECRTPALLSNIPAERWSVAERRIDGNGDDCGGGADPLYIQQPGYDPAYDPSSGGAGACSDGSGGGEDDPWGPDNGPEPTVSVSYPGGGSGSCHTEYITIEISYDGGESWELIYSGEARVC
jgi:hypothetical protein